MNTKVPYRRPSHRSKYGFYKSKTLVSVRGEVHVHVTISLVWFNGLGWYYTVELEGFKTRGGERTHIVDISHSHGRRLWRHGRELSCCASTAEEEARVMCEEHGIPVETLEAFVLGTRY